MKKVIVLLIGFCLLLTGCGILNSKNVVKEFEKKVKDCNAYQLKGQLTIHNNEDVYQYDVEVLYKKEDQYRVTLTNTANDHTQIILKNKDGVYVLTPALNKSFRFQSDWPYHNSQIYLLDALVEDLNRDEKTEVTKKEDKYVLETKVEYPNNKKLVQQKIVFDSDLKPEKVVVYDENGIDCMTMIFDKINYSPKLSKEDFELENIITSDEPLDEVEETSSLEDVIYPLFLPNGTKLVSEEKMSKNNGERVIMNYDGEKSFVLVEETIDVFDEFTVIPSSGEPFRLMDTLGVITNNSLSWTSGGVEFYLISDVMSQEEMVEVAESVIGVISMK